MDVGVDFADVAQRVSERCRLSGEFVLRSGQTSTTYFDKYLFEGDPAILRDVAQLMARWCRATSKCSLASNLAASL